MRVIFNCFMKSELSYLNGLTFDCIGHNNGMLQIDVEDTIYEVDLDEIIIVDIQKELKNAAIRHDKTFCDYWYAILTIYLKVNKIKVVISELPTEIADRTENILSTFDEISNSVNDLNLFENV